MCPSSWKLYLDDFPFLGSSLAHLEPKLELFEFWEFGSWWLFVARLYPIYVLFAFKIFLLPVPTRPGTRPFLQVPVPSRNKKPLPVGPCSWRLDVDCLPLGVMIMPELERFESVTLISPRHCPAVLTMFTGRGGASIATWHGLKSLE